MAPGGQPKFKYVRHKKRWASFGPIRGKEIEIGQHREGRHIHNSVVRYLPELTPDMAIGFRGEVYEVIQSSNVDNRNIFTEFQAVLIPGAFYEIELNLIKFENGSPAQFENGERVQLDSFYQAFFEDNRPVQFEDGKIVEFDHLPQFLAFFEDNRPAQFEDGQHVEFDNGFSNLIAFFENGTPAKFENGDPVEFDFIEKPGQFEDGVFALFEDGQPVQFD